MLTSSYESSMVKLVVNCIGNYPGANICYRREDAEKRKKDDFDRLSKIIFEIVLQE